MRRPPNLQPHQPPADPKTGIVKLRGDTQLPVIPSPVSSDFASPNASTKMDVIFSEIDKIRPASFPLIDRLCIPKKSRVGYRQDAPFSSKNAPDTKSDSASKEDSTQGAKCGPFRGGYHESPPSSHTCQSRTGPLTLRWNTRSTYGKGTKMKGGGGQCF